MTPIFKCCGFASIMLLPILLLRQQYVASVELSNFNHADDAKLHNLKLLLTELIFVASPLRCFVIITDETYHPLYDHNFFRISYRLRTYFYIKIHNSEDLLAPNYQTIRVLKQIREIDCDFHIVTLLNALQAKRFLRFAEKHRILNTKQKFVFLHDSRILERDMLYIWSNLISVVFLKYHEDNRYSISTVSYPDILNGVVVTNLLMNWKIGRRINSANLFPDKSSNLKGIDLPVVVFKHVPMVTNGTDNKTYGGVEVEILNALGLVLNFKPKFYETEDNEIERWGRELPNGSFTGVIGQMQNRTARIAIGNLHLYKLYAEILDLSWPHSYECMTFLTQESSKDDSWRTLIQPFSGGMWAAVLLSLLFMSIVFYLMSFTHALLLRQELAATYDFFLLFRRQRRRNRTQSATADIHPSAFRDVRFRAYLHRLRISPHQDLDLFDNFGNCMLHTYSMLMFVSLPSMPRNWPLRVLTGFFWLYAILLAVTYRASLTAILANPAARITVDTLEELVKSRITAAAWVKENKKFFDDAFDEVAQEVGFKMEIIDDIDGVTERIAKGHYAYYDNEFFLRHLRLKGTKRREENEENEVVLHIMRECVINMPVALGLEKNSPLKPHIDKYIQRLSEGGLLFKWLKDATEDLSAEEQAPQEALMDLHKMWSSFVALAVGYFFGICAIVAEKLHFKYIVRKHPLYDQYNPNLYYNFKRKFPDL